jgi:DNA polymerase-4
MDCFYAAIETRDNPNLEGKPVAIGGKSRGVLCTCNYETRRYGLHSAMPTYKAFKKCESLVLLPVNMKKYKEVSAEIHKILNKYSDIIEPLSLDEAYLDVTGSELYSGSATLIARAIRREIYEKHKLTASAGVAPNKFLAKIASDWKKPNGQFVITPKEIKEFIKSLDINKIYGVGSATAVKLRNMGVTTCEDLQQYERVRLIEIFGKYGNEVYDLSRDIDNRQVQSARKRKSFSLEKTYPNDLKTIDELNMGLKHLYSELMYKLKEEFKNKVSSSFVKLKFNDFTETTAEVKEREIELSKLKYLLIKAKERGEKKDVRLIGIGVRFKYQKIKNIQKILNIS